MSSPAGNMATIAAAAEGVIKALTPRVEAEYPFYSTPENEGDLDGMRLAGDEDMRRFMVYGEPDPRPKADHWNGLLVEVDQTLVVGLRYSVPENRGGFQRAARAASVDAAQITGALLADYPWAGEDTLTTIIQKGTPRTRKKGQGVYTIRLEFTCTYFHEVDP